MLNKENFEKLRNEIVLNSVFVKDFNNSLNIDAQKVCDFFNSAVYYINDEYKVKMHKDIELNDITIDMLFNYYMSFDCDPLEPNKKYYVVQLLNECNDIYFNELVDDDYYGDKVFLYRSGYNGINADVIKFIINNIVNFSQYDLEYYKNNMAAYLIDELKPYKNISLKNAIKLAKIVKSDNASENAVICASLQAIYNKRYELTVLRGYCQDDWIKCYYAIDELKPNQLREIEGIYFNTGVEIMIHDGDNVPTCADDVSGCCVYIVPSHASLKDDIAELLGENKDDIVLYEIARTYKVTKIEYKEV